MSRREDFDIVEDDEVASSGSGRSAPPWWIWLGGATLLIVLAGAFALTTFSQRVSSSPTPTPAPNLATVPAVVALATDTPDLNQATAEATALASATPSPLPTETPTPEPEPTPTPCPFAIAQEFASSYSMAEFGCALGPAQIVWSAWQPFQGGQMFWRRDTDRAYILSNAGIYSPITERWDGGASPNRGDPPPGYIAPERGFGAVWARSDEIFNILGWAVSTEKGFCALIQDFEYGMLVESDPIANCTPENLYNHAGAGDWQRLFFRFTEAGTWR